MKRVWKWPRRRRGRAAADPCDARLTLADLEAAVRSVEPAARLVPPRLLRRVIRTHASLRGFGFRVPHGKTYIISSKELLEIADRDELGLPNERLPETVILLERPAAEDLEDKPRGELLLQYWELLFHACVHCQLERALVVPASASRSESLPAEAGTTAARRIAELGERPFDEIRNVLRQERFLLPCGGDAAVYIEFAAVYLGLRYFKPFLLAGFFPALRSLEDVDRVIAQDIDAAELLEATRLPGTPAPEELCAAARRAAEALDVDPFAEDSGGQAPSAVQFQRIPVGQRSERKYLSWSRRAARQAARGNFAGAAIRRARAERWAPRESAAEAATNLREEIERLAGRLQAALGITDDDPRPWRESLLALAHQTPRGLWTVEARLLYDLQKACVDRERPTSTVDVMHWVLSFGRRAICRDLPDQRRVAISRHLRSAQRRLARVRISDRQRQQLAGVLGAATAAAEARLREDLRPKITAALDAIDLRPQNLPEEVARRKIVEELLDRIVERGFLTLSEVRDAISRNNLKEPDCSGARSFLRGEAALRANRRLTDALDGVYEPGDFYLRWILRFSHLMFGTAVGRFLTLFFVIPYGGPIAVLMTLDHLMGLVGVHHLHLVSFNVRTAGFARLIALGVFLQLLIYVPWLRRAIWQGLLLLCRAVRFLLVDALRWFVALRWVDIILRSRTTRLIVNFVVKPVVPTLVVASFVPADTAPGRKLAGLAAVYVGLLIVVNSRVGRTLEEMVLDGISEGWQRFGWRPIVGIFWFIVNLFRRLLQGIERILYTVDEWLRFRRGQGRVMLVAKAVMGIAWFFVAYFVRFVVNLLIEPQVNPLKHFPWVTAAHKMLWPLLLSSGLREFLMTRLGPAAGDTLFFVIGTAAPGIFGFLIWEFTANWRLFAANRPKNLRPARIGSHGETMPRLLRPGIHSGTIPKRFAKLRRAERKALDCGDYGAARKHREALHHVEVDLRRYVQREFIAWFAACPGWTRPLPQVRDIHLATNEAEIGVEMPRPMESSLGMSFQLADDAVQLVLSGDCILEHLPIESRNIYLLVLTNVLKTAAVAVLNDAESRTDVATLAVPWSDWVAAWESNNEALNGPARGLIPLR